LRHRQRHLTCTFNHLVYLSRCALRAYDNRGLDLRSPLLPKQDLVENLNQNGGQQCYAHQDVEAPPDRHAFSPENSSVGGGRDISR
jgi:hypothetical protein